jgi:MFS family permease
MRAPDRSTLPDATPLAVALTGALCLAALMGVGRFAYTPVLPLMLADGSVGLAEASALASLNYLGYLVGALACAMGLTRWLQRLVDKLRERGGAGRMPMGTRSTRSSITKVPTELAVLGAALLATAVLTAAMALPWVAGWTLWRLLAGAVSAVGFVLSTQWCLTRLAQQGHTAMGGLMYTGPGFGIAVGGLLGGAMAAMAAPGWAAWLVFAALALTMAALAWRTLGGAAERQQPTANAAAAAAVRPRHGATRAASGTDSAEPTTPTSAPSTASWPTASASAAPSPAPTRPATDQGEIDASPAPPITAPEPTSDRLALWGLTAAYGLAGFGYIIPATFLPVMARAWLVGGSGAGGTGTGVEVGGALLADLFWPLFGLGIVVGAALASRVRESLDVRVALVVCYLLQASGVALAAWRPDATGLALGSLLLGLPFTAITFFAMREVRRLRPHSATRWIGLTTASYGIGQIIGPPVAAWLVARMGQEAAGFTAAMHLATATLLAGAGIFAWLVVSRPR